MPKRGGGVNHSGLRQAAVLLINVDVDIVCCKLCVILMMYLIVVNTGPLPPVNTIRDVMYGKVMILIMPAMYYTKGLAVVVTT